MSQVEAAILSRRALLRGCALLGAGASMGALPGWAFAAEGIEGQWPAVTAMLDKYVRSRQVAGMIAALGWGDKAPGYIARGREGFADRDPSSPDSLYRAYSMTKPITGMAAMILIDEGRIGLDQPVADFIPEFARLQVAIDPQTSLAARPAQNVMTIRHLLTHTSGLGYAVVGRDKPSQELARLGVNPGLVSLGKLSGINDGAPTPGPDEFLRRTALVPLVAEPGARWSYSMGLDVLGLLIGRVTGQELESFVHERIFAPAGMTSSWFQVPPRANKHLTTNYSLLGRRPVAIDGPGHSVYQARIPFAFGGSGLVTSPADYDRFLTMLVGRGTIGGRRVMSEAAVRMGTSNLLPATADLSGTWVAGNHFGAGGIVGTGKDEGLFGWSGAAGTVGYAQLRLGLRTGLFVQYMPQEKLPILEEFPKAVGADLSTQGIAK
ncbi:serine hydrolase domain-containing protein [Novosphingobium sp.]|uniref:serine hydrolase domain-containing protein n=1 Tax=Novosphingobium sp. TaxID=1874826 RepID=UPI0035B390CB